MSKFSNDKTQSSQAKQIGLRLPEDLYQWYLSVPLGQRRSAIVEAIRAGKDRADTGLNLDGLALYIDQTNDAIDGLIRKNNIYDLALFHLQTRIEKLEENSADPPA